MKRRYRVWSMVSLVWLVLAGYAISPALGATLQFNVTSAPAGGTSIATIRINHADEVESFFLTLNFTSGTTLSLATAGWFTRKDYYPASPFGPAPQVDRNHVQTTSSQTKVFLNGFAPEGNSGNIGIVTFTVNDEAEDGESQVLSLSGQYRNRSSGTVENFPAVTTTFTVGDYPGDLNQDDIIDLKDVILGLQIQSGQTPSEPVYKIEDLNGNGRLDLPEVINALQHTGGVK